MLDRVRVPLVVRAAGTRNGREFKGIDEANREMGWELAVQSRKLIRRLVKLEGAAVAEIGGTTYTFSQRKAAP
ncbi:hypothetical protein [Paraburkholderia phosphatilytica]|uniref:hypothetical protein n=1 Tax=Paraburkholderia phosphatilytica TaxID=2282883 RepID=UPI000E52BC3B|nr:hypothetical protein [Paraburkholderia phosphatilytica]